MSNGEYVMRQIRQEIDESKVGWITNERTMKPSGLKNQRVLSQHGLVLSESYSERL